MDNKIHAPAFNTVFDIVPPLGKLKVVNKDAFRAIETAVRALPITTIGLQINDQPELLLYATREAELGYCTPDNLPLDVSIVLQCEHMGTREWEHMIFWALCYYRLVLGRPYVEAWTDPKQPIHVVKFESSTVVPAKNMPLFGSFLASEIPVYMQNGTVRHKRDLDEAIDRAMRKAHIASLRDNTKVVAYDEVDDLDRMYEAVKDFPARHGDLYALLMKYLPIAEDLDTTALLGKSSGDWAQALHEWEERGITASYIATQYPTNNDHLPTATMVYTLIKNNRMYACAVMAQDEILLYRTRRIGSQSYEPYFRSKLLTAGNKKKMLTVTCTAASYEAHKEEFMEGFMLKEGLGEVYSVYHRNRLRA
jgi:hypothetical protein